MAQQILSIETLFEHYDSFEARVDALRSSMDDEINIFYRDALRRHGFEVGDRVAFHNASYYITELVIIAKEVYGDNDKFIEFGVRRYYPDSGSIRWLRLDALDEFTKVSDEE